MPKSIIIYGQAFVIPILTNGAYNTLKSILTSRKVSFDPNKQLEYQIDIFQMKILRKNLESDSQEETG